MRVVHTRRLDDLTEQAQEDLLTAMAHQVEAVFEIAGVRPPTFALVVGVGGPEVQCISNCSKRSVIRVLRACADRLEAEQGAQVVAMAQTD